MTDSDGVSTSAGLGATEGFGAGSSITARLGFAISEGSTACSGFAGTASSLGKGTAFAGSGFSIAFGVLGFTLASVSIVAGFSSGLRLSISVGGAVSGLLGSSAGLISGCSLCTGACKTSSLSFGPSISSMSGACIGVLCLGLIIGAGILGSSAGLGVSADLGFSAGLGFSASTLGLTAGFFSTFGFSMFSTISTLVGSFLLRVLSAFSAAI